MSKRFFTFVCNVLFLLNFNFAWCNELSDIAVFPQMGHGSPVVAVAYSPDGRFIASGSAADEGNHYDGTNENSVKIWDALSGREIITFFSKPPKKVFFSTV